MTIDDVTTSVNNGKLLSIQRMAAAVVLLKKGVSVDGMKSIYALKRLIKALIFQINANQLNATTNALYTCLLNQLNGFGGNYVIDPTVNSGAQVIIIGGFNSGIIPFTTNGPFVLNYSSYQQLYGPNPTLSIYTIQGGIEQEDEQTAPIIVRSAPGISNPINTITLDYPVGVTVTGYILISGTPTSGVAAGGSGGGSTVATFNFDDSDLLQDGNGSWYLPLTLPTGLRPSYVESNGVQVTGLFDDTFTPNRLYGFANNDTQTILVKAI